MYEIYRQLEFSAILGASHDDALLFARPFVYDELLDGAELAVGAKGMIASLDAERDEVATA
jgi:hypothetical protein